jgi:hypothetical protein
MPRSICLQREVPFDGARSATQPANGLPVNATDREKACVQRDNLEAIADGTIGGDEHAGAVGVGRAVGWTGTHNQRPPGNGGRNEGVHRDGTLVRRRRVARVTMHAKKPIVLLHILQCVAAIDALLT